MGRFADGHGSTCWQIACNALLYLSVRLQRPLALNVRQVMSDHVGFGANALEPDTNHGYTDFVDPASQGLCGLHLPE